MRDAINNWSMLCVFQIYANATTNIPLYDHWCKYKLLFISFDIQFCEGLDVQYIITVFCTQDMVYLCIYIYIMQG